MKEPPLRTTCGGGSFVLRSTPGRGLHKELGPSDPAQFCGKTAHQEEGRARFPVAVRLGWDGAYIFGSFQQPGAHAYGILGESQAP